MRCLVSLILATLVLTVPFAAHAQDALDRVEPTRLEERKIERLEAEPQMVTTPKLPEVKADPGGAAVRVGAIELMGLNRLRAAYFSDIVQSYIGNSLSSYDVAGLVEKIANRARERYPLASARVAPQNIVAGILRVIVDEGRVDGVELSGFANDRVQAALKTLVTGRPVTTAELERVLLLARDFDGVTIRETTIRRDGDRNVLVVKGIYRRLRGQLSIDNDTTRPIGPFELFGFVQANGVFTHDDSLQAYFLAALPQPDELAFLRLKYAKRIDNAGTVISLAGSLSQSNPGSYLAALKITGNSRWASLAISRPIERSVRSSVWLEGSVSSRELRQARSGNRSRHDRLMVARIRMFGSAHFGGGELQSGAALAKGLPILGATGSGDAMASRPDADGTFTSLLLNGQWSARLAGPVKLAVGIRTQLATRPLLVSEEIGLGGARFARGYEYSERSGDQGTMGYLEIAYDLNRKTGPFNGIAPYAFLDGGKVMNLSRGGGGGSLLSAGGGIRFDVDRRTDAALEVAAPLSGPRYESNTRGVRVRVSLTRYF